MALIAEQLPNLMNGVSQQAVTMRLTSQANEQVNALSSIVYGNIKRPPSIFRAKLDLPTGADAYWHTINRDVTERYKVAVRDSDIEVFGLDGTKYTVNAPDGFGYLAGEGSAIDVADDVRAVTVADYTFILNKNKTVSKKTDLSPGDTSDCILFVKSVNYGVTYTVKIDDTEVASYTTDSQNDTEPSISVEGVINALAGDITTNLDTSSSGPWFVNKFSPILYLRKRDGSDFKIEVSDSDGNVHFSAVKDKVQRFTDLPAIGRAGFRVEITGDDDSEFDSYYLNFEPNNETNPDGSPVYYDNGNWVETVKPGIEYQLDPSTMPHVLVRESDGTFTFKQAEWGERVVGDLESSPWPSFVGRKIRDIYFDRRRLCVLSDDNVIMSRAGGFFSFFPESVLTILDDGPIDVSATGTSVSLLSYAIPFNRRILLFSEQAQFVIDDPDLLASRPPGLKKITEYESSNVAAPVASGRTIFFPVSKGAYSGVLEYYVLEDTDTTDAADVAEHVPRYIPKGIVQMAASDTASVVVALSEESRNKLYVYKHHWNGNEKLQSSWSRWEFPENCEIYSVQFIKNELYLVTKYESGVFIESINMEENLSEPGESFVYRLDRRVTEEDCLVSYDPANNETIIVFPFEAGAASDDVRIVTRSGGGTSDKPEASNVSILETIVGGSQTTVRVRGDYSATKFFVGIKYDHVYEFSPVVPKTSSASGGSASVLTGRLQILRWHVHCDTTGYTKAEVAQPGRVPYVYSFTGTTLGTEKATVGAVNLSSGVFSFRVNGRNDRVSIRLSNDTFLPSAFTAAEWEGRYNRNTSRI